MCQHPPVYIKTEKYAIMEQILYMRPTYILIVKCACESGLPFLEGIPELQKYFSFVCCLSGHPVVLKTVGRKGRMGRKVTM